MSIFHRHEPSDAEERRKAIREANTRLQKTRDDPDMARLIELSDYLRGRNDRNHYAQLLQEAYGRPTG